MSRGRLLGTVAVALLAPLLAARAAAAAPPINTMCPVLTDEKADPSITTEYRGKTIAFCCPMCRRDFLEDPEPYLAALPGFDASGAAPEAAAEKEGTAAPEVREPEREETGVGRLVSWLGEFHPLVIHFPIALALVSALAELLSLVLRRETLAHAARFGVAVAGIGGVAAAALGWAAAWKARYPGELAATLERHRWFGTGTAALLLLVLVLSEVGRRRPSAGALRAYRLLLLAAVPLVVVTSHLGGTLVFGPDPLTWPW